MSKKNEKVESSKPKMPKRHNKSGRGQLRHPNDAGYGVALTHRWQDATASWLASWGLAIRKQHWVATA